MLTTASPMLVMLSSAEPVLSGVPWMQVFLGAIGLCSMTAYAVNRQKSTSRYVSNQNERSSVLLIRHVWQWLEEHHYLVRHARVEGK